MFEQLLHGLTWVQVCFFLGAYIVPQISQAITTHPSGWTHTWTILLAAASTLIGEATRPNFDFKSALGVFVGAVVVALAGRLHIKGTWWEAWLKGHVIKPSTTTVAGEQAAA